VLGLLCRVCQVSCGPYHAAAIGSDGRLFTWGDGLFGKLGHGDHCSSHSPRFVTTLAGMPTTAMETCSCQRSAALGGGHYVVRDATTAAG
jgi:alpha-tubulin suppressor-like RCC1 family protein